MRRLQLGNETTADDNETESLPVLPETTAYWSREPYAWSTSVQDYTPPLLTSSHCAKAVYDLFHNTYYSEIGNMDPFQPNFLLSVVAESSSHPSGLTALYAQPWMYAGPGLGNLDECPMQTCIAGGRKTDSITFASVCMMPECSAYDLASEDFVSTVARQFDSAIDGSTPQETIDLGREYVMTLRRIADLNKFLKTGWTCGAFVVPFEPFPFGAPYVGLNILLVVLAILGTTCKRQRRQLRLSKTHREVYAEKEIDNDTTNTTSEESSALLRHGDLTPTTGWSNGTRFIDSSTPANLFWSAFDVSSHLKRLISPEHSVTACLDGLRVGSIFWIMLGHTMAIQSSSGAGYSNPANFLPPTGLTTTIAGQLLFSSRLAVDTFLTISGFLVVSVLDKKFPAETNFSVGRSPSLLKDVFTRYITIIPSLVISHVGRVLPLYAMCLGFYTQIAPHLGSGPFWHQWIALLKPCHDSVWTNFLFVNNFFPFETQTTNTCFYHSWYLAVDMQLFVLAPLLVFWYQFNSLQGKVAVGVLFLGSVGVTAYLTHTRQWSVNTFDGISVDRYDMEAYAKPHVRAQAYLAGMFVAMLLLSDRSRQLSNQQRLANDDSNKFARVSYTWRHRAIMATSLLAMAAVTFGTVTGAYARRPCTYMEDPLQDECGSLWSPFTTFWYTGFSRTAWVIATANIIHLSVGRGSWGSGDGNLVSAILSWTCWTPLSQLSFGAYLIHPIVIFVWQLGDREKQTFRLSTFGMDYLSVCVVSFVAALLAAVVVEFPCAVLWKTFVTGAQWKYTSLRTSTGAAGSSVSNLKQRSLQRIVQLEQKVPPTAISPLTPQYEYGSLQPINGGV